MRRLSGRLVSTMFVPAAALRCSEAVPQTVRGLLSIQPDYVLNLTAEKTADWTATVLGPPGEPV
jgi:hypothetical protein